MDYNNFPFNNSKVINEVNILPKTVNISMVLRNVDKHIKDLEETLKNKKANKELYNRLVQKDFTLFCNIEIIPGINIPLYLYNRGFSDDDLYGVFGYNDYLSTKSKVGIFLPMDVNHREGMISVTDRKINQMESVLYHEITHACQFLDIVIRYLRFKNKLKPNSELDRNEVLEILETILRKRFEGKALTLKKMDEVIKYLSSKAERGAHAAAFFRQLVKDRELFQEVLDCCKNKFYNFESIDKKLIKKGLDEWKELTALSIAERDSGILAIFKKEKNTIGYLLKKSLLETTSQLFGLLTNNSLNLINTKN